MTVCATNVALLNLENHSTPRFVSRENDDAVFFQTGIAVIEIKDDDVGLAAIDAWMTSQVLAYERAVLVAVFTDPRDLLPDVGVAVSEVMLTSVLGVTGTTATLAGALPRVGERKRINWLESATVVAPLERGLAGRHREGDRHDGPLRSGSALRSA